ncbi:hypothetical protein niasHT_014774 [Heterodera trifolii]|uniref:DNA-directed DNA polymerase n=1 Tax=Heterodera trifolii TaxID=157864 RepID=A0ABD2L6J0_9BILA
MLGYDEEGEKPRSVTTYAYAHAGSRYDHVLIYGEMLRMGVRPELVRQGNHLLEMKARKRGAITTTIFRDSYKLIPIKLASFVKTFGLQIDGVDNKKYFPHKFNKAANYGVVLDSLPPLEDYYPGGPMNSRSSRLLASGFCASFLISSLVPLGEGAFSGRGSTRRSIDQLKSESMNSRPVFGLMIFPRSVAPKLCGSDIMMANR